MCIRDRAELVGLISEQAGALNDLTTRLLTTARLDAGEIAVNASPVGVGPLVNEVLAGLRDRLANMSVSIDIPEDDLVLICDRQLMAMLLTQYIDNACKLSLIHISGRAEGRQRCPTTSPERCCLPWPG